MKKIPVFFLLFTVLPAVITFAQEIQQGNATWYEDDSHDLTASHARLPPGTRLRVTNLNNQREVYVTVTDRIQNSDNRILDLSQEAATLLDMNKRGYTPVRMVVIRGLVADTPPDNTGESADEYDAEPVPEITVITVSPDDEDYQDYENDEGYGNDAELANDDYEADEPVKTAAAETPPTPPPPVRVFPEQPASRNRPEQAARPPERQAPAASAGTGVLLKKIVVLINGREQTIDIPEGVYIPVPGSAPPAPDNPPPAPGRAPAYQPYPPPSQRSAPPPPPAQTASIKIIPKLPDPYSGKVYRVQVGAYSRVVLAQGCFDRLKAAGFSPAYEQNGTLYRVVLSGIRSADMSDTARRLNAAGFTEAWIREESRR